MSVCLFAPARAVITSERPFSAQRRYSTEAIGIEPFLRRMAISFVTPFGTVDSASVTLSIRTLTSTLSTAMRLPATLMMACSCLLRFSSGAVATSCGAGSFDHPARLHQHRLRDRDAERLGSPEVHR